MTPGINLQQTLSRTMLAVGDEPQLVYVLLEAHAEGVAQQLPNCRSTCAWFSTGVHRCAANV
jgi:hypothetical protein